MPFPFRSKTSTRSALLLALAIAVLPSTAPAEELSPADLIGLLQKGGLVLYLRHARTEVDYADQVVAVVGDCATQRMLSAEGWRQARLIGAAVAANEIPVSEVISSEYCRAWQTADLAFGHFATTAALNFEPAETYSDAQMARMADNVAPLLAAPVAVGNRVIVGHDDPFEAATGIYPEPQGVAYVLRPDGAGGFAVLGRIGPEDW
jgi:phosphohistidine phosphatase SixA